jgi:probable rRNA maturation factor
MSASVQVSAEMTVECDSWRALSGLETFVAETLQAAVAASGDELAEGAEISLLFCDDARIRELNRQFRGQDKPTNVLSFPGPEPLESAQFLGDIAMAFETVAREAQEQGKTLEQHSRHMIVHGVLHLLGYDHEESDEAEAMEALEIDILNKLGVENPYRDDENEETIDHERA